MSVVGAAGRDGIRDGIRSFLLETFLKGAKAASITDGTRLLGGDLIDSIGMLELTVHLEESYGITIAAEEVNPQNFGALGSLAAFVEGKAASR